MARYTIANVIFVIDEYFNPFEVNGYKFFSKYKEETTSKNLRSFISTPKQKNRKLRQHNTNAYVEFRGKQHNSIIFYDQSIRNKKVKRIHDILILGSILTGYNWSLYSLRYEPFFPVTPVNHLNTICPNSNEIEEYLILYIDKITNASWRLQFENGFHLRMLFNRSNINNIESRFLSYVVIWEWLYPHLKNPNGATKDDETYYLDKIMNYILKYYWSHLINEDLFTDSYKCIFYFLRNQLAHSGKLPLNRPKIEPWMANLQWMTDYRQPVVHGIGDYIKFFCRLTQVVVLKTLGINAEDKLDVFSFSKQLEAFLMTGKID